MNIGNCRVPNLFAYTAAFISRLAGTIRCNKKHKGAWYVNKLKQIDDGTQYRCWFLSAAASSFVTKQANQLNRFNLRFRHCSRSKPTTINNKFPLKATSGNILDAQLFSCIRTGRNNLEKYNKLHRHVEKPCYILPVTSYVLLTFAQFCFYACYATC
ncbi:MAG: hypothetical protein K0R82_2310 [Flavipsychrobacter sp.]|nr:hypothetical protein [Flavipsychrobacter sp.]